MPKFNVCFASRFGHPICEADRPVLIRIRNGTAPAVPQSAHRLREPAD